MWSALRPDLVSMLLRLRDEGESTTTSTPAPTVAYNRLGFVELCFFPDTATGKPHTALGMKTDVVIE